MAQRIQVPSNPGGRNIIELRLPGGATISVTDPRGPADPDICCFCGETVDDADSECVTLTASWLEHGSEKHQSWAAHRRCLAERMDERVRGVGPFLRRRADIELNPIDVRFLPCPAARPGRLRRFVTRARACSRLTNCPSGGAGRRGSYAPEAARGPESGSKARRSAPVSNADRC